MASVKKSTLPLKPTVNPKIATTVTTKPVVRKPLVSKVSSQIVTKKPTVPVKATSEKITAVKSATPVKSTFIKPAAPASPTKKPLKSSTTSNAAKVIPPVKSAVADSTSMLKAKSTEKSALKTSSLTTVKKPVSKVVAPAPAVKKPSTMNAPKSISAVQTETSVKLAPKIKVSAVKSAAPPSVPVKATRSPSITNVTLSSPVKTSKPAVRINAPYTIAAKTSTKLIKSNVGVKVPPSKSFMAAKPVNGVTSTPVKSATRDAIKRLQDVSEIEIRDADSTTREEKDLEERVPEDSSCTGDENGNSKQESQVDEERVYAVAEQLIFVMQPEELEVITGDVEQLNKDTYVIDMRAVEAQETETETSIQEDTLSSEDKVTNIDLETLSNQASTEAENIEDHDSKVFEMYEMKMQEITDIHPNFSEEAESTPMDGSLTADENPEFRPSSAAGGEQEMSERDIPNYGQNELFQELSPPSDIETPTHKSNENELENEADEQNNRGVECVHDDSEVVGVSGDKLTSVIDYLPNNSSAVIINVEEDSQSTPVISNAESIQCSTGMMLENDTCNDTTIFDNAEVENSSDVKPALLDIFSTSQADVENLKETPSEDGMDMVAELPSEADRAEQINDESLVDPNSDEIPHDVDVDHQSDELICFDIPLSVDDLAHNVLEPECCIPSELSCNEDSLVVEQKMENFMAFGNVEDIIGMSYAEVVISSKTASDDDSLETIEAVNAVDEDDGVECYPPVHLDEPADNCHEVETAVVDSAAGSIPIYILYDNTKFPDVVPSDEHTEKQDHEHEVEVDQHEDTFDKICRKRNKRRNKKNRKSISNSENLDEQLPNNVYNEKPNYQSEYHGRRRNSRIRCRNSRAYYEAFYQSEQPHQQEYYRDPHWKYTT